MEPEVDVDRPQGSDYTSFFTNEDWRACAERCAREEQCWSWTWVKPGVQGAVAKCWLKSIVPPAVPDGCCISGIRSAAGLPPIGCSALFGSWRWSGGAQVRCSSDGVCSNSHGLSGRWSCIPDSSRFQVRWTRGEQVDAFIDTFLISPDGRYLAGTNQYGIAMGAVRE